MISVSVLYEISDLVKSRLKKVSSVGSGLGSVVGAGILLHDKLKGNDNDTEPVKSPAVGKLVSKLHDATGDDRVVKSGTLSSDGAKLNAAQDQTPIKHKTSMKKFSKPIEHKTSMKKFSKPKPTSGSFQGGGSDDASW